MERINCDLVVTKPFEINGDIIISGNLYATANITARNIDVDGDIILISDSVEAIIDAYNIKCRILKVRNFAMLVDTVTASEGFRLESDDSSKVIIHGETATLTFASEDFDLWEDD